MESFLRRILPFESRVDGAKVVPNNFVGARLLFFENGPSENETYKMMQNVEGNFENKQLNILKNYITFAKFS